MLHYKNNIIYIQYFIKGVLKKVSEFFIPAD